MMNFSPVEDYMRAVEGTAERRISMIRKLYKLWPNPKLLVHLWLLAAIQAILQGLMLGLLVPVLRSLLRPTPDFTASAP